jgi:exonuclease SbcC
MRITYLDLENIKSYSASTRIDLTAGLNAICGLNGSGKTTVLEAIGFAVFNFLPYKQEAFVREGQKYGNIRVGLLARDEREYEIVRRVGSSGAYYVCDVETGSRLAERAEAVADWVRQYALDMEAEADLAALFKNAVGVPQGLMTSDFLVSATTRKAIFDPLLRVEEYRDAWEYLRKVEGYLRDRMATVDQEIARLEGETEQIPGLEEQAADLREQEQRGQEALDRTITDLEGLTSRLRALDELEQRLDDLRNQLREADHGARRHGDRLDMERRSLEVARDARRTLEDTQHGYELVSAARGRLKELDGQSRERDKLIQQHADAKANSQQVFGGIEQLDRKREECEEAAREASTLVELVTRQDELDHRLRELQGILRDRNRLDKQIAGIRRTVADLERARADRKKRMASAGEAQEQSKAIEAAQQELERLNSQLAELTPLKERRAQLAEEGKRLKERHDRLQADVKTWSSLQQRIEEHRRSVAALEELSSHEQELRDRKARVAAAIEYQEYARADLGQRRCPLLEVECPVVLSDGKTLIRLDARASTLSAEGAELDGQLSTLASQVDGARSAAAELQQLLLDAAALGRSRADLEQIVPELEACREQYRELNSRLDGEKELKKKQQRLQDDVARYQALVRTAAELPLLKEQDEHDAEVLALQRAELERLGEERAEVDSSAAEANEIENQLESLGDPRRRQQALLAVAARKPEVEANLAAEQEKLVDAMGRVKALAAALVHFESLDEMIAAERQIVEASQDAYDRYLGCREEATQVEARESAVEQTTVALEAAERLKAEIEQEQEGTAKQYDAERHQRLRAECDEVNRTLVQAQTRLEHTRDQLRLVDERLGQLLRRREKLGARRGEREGVVRVERAVKFIRDTINNAGPAVTEHLLRNISRGASDVYEEIMDDHAAELRWDKNYEVLVQRGAETRTFVQLSGGEQMSAALAVRLALLKEMSDVDFAFFDEPTQNMDTDRRSNLADQIRQVRGFEQLIVISHDDTFEHHTDNLIRLRKQEEETLVEQ